MKRYVYLAAAAIMMLLAGIIYAWSILKTPFAGFGWDAAALGMNFTVTMWCFCFGGIIGGVLIKKLPLWVLLVGSGFLSGLGFFLSGRIDGGSVVMLYLAYGALCGIGIGIAYNVILTTVLGWFPDKRATVSGVLMMSYGASSLVLGSVISRLMNSFSWRVVFGGLGGVMFAVFIVGAVILRAPKAANAAASESDNDATPAKMLKTPAFWLFYTFTILIVSIGSYGIGFAKDLSLAAGADETLAVYLVGTLAVCNGLGRVTSGALFDKIGARGAIRTASAIAVCAAALLLVSVALRSQILFIPAVILTGFSYGFMPPISSGYIGTVFGRKNFAVNFGIANTMLLFSSSSAAVGGAVYGATGGYTAVFVMLSAFSVAGGALGLILTRKKAAE